MIPFKFHEIFDSYSSFPLKPPKLQSWSKKNGLNIPEIHHSNPIGDFGALTAVARAGSSQAKAALMLCRFLESEIEVGNDAIVQFMQQVIHTFTLHILTY